MQEKKTNRNALAGPKNAIDDAGGGASGSGNTEGGI